MAESEDSLESALKTQFELASKALSQDDDEDHLFALQVAKRLKKFPDEQSKEIAKVEIMSLINRFLFPSTVQYG